MSGEHPIAIISESERDTVSYPIEEQIKDFVEETKDAVCFDSDVIGHLAVDAGTEIQIS